LAEIDDQQSFILKVSLASAASALLLLALALVLCTQRGAALLLRLRHISARGDGSGW
jgi:hypothetical protein